MAASWYESVHKALVDVYFTVSMCRKENEDCDI